MGGGRWSRWLKYGIIGFIIGLVGLIFALLGRSLLPVLSIGAFLNFPAVAIISLFNGGNMSFEIFYTGGILAPIIYFILGSLIGMIVSKIKRE